MLKKSMVYLTLAMFLTAGSMSNVDAKRLGGSKNVGKQAPTATQKQAAPTQPAAPAAAPNQAAKPATPATPATAAPAKKGFGWGGMLGGLAAGLGLAWLLSHFGMGEAVASFLMGFLLVLAVAMVGFWLLRKFAGSKQATLKTSTPNGFDAGRAYEPQQHRPEPTMGGYAAPAAQARDDFQGFDQQLFIDNAKKHFVALQDSWDRGDVQRLREFTTPQMFLELERDLLARANQLNRTEVLTLDAEVMGQEKTEDVYQVSVRFSGMIREEIDGTAESFVEVWNLTKPANGSGGWVLAGISQLV